MSVTFQVWFLEEEKLPIVSRSPIEQNKFKILMKSPWEILQAPIGSGGVISLLSSHNMTENLNELGVEYIEVWSIQYKTGSASDFLSWSPPIINLISYQLIVAIHFTRL